MKFGDKFFFATSERFVNAFDFKEDIDKAIIDVNHAHFWDITSVSALDKVVIKFRREGIDIEIKGMNEATATLVDKFGIHDDPKKLKNSWEVINYGSRYHSKTCVIGCIDRSSSAIAVCHASAWIAQTLNLPLTLLHMNEKSQHRHTMT